jgi:hypothetical protein
MFTQAEDFKKKCLACGENVTYPNWKCKKLPGHHKVAEQVFFHLGGGHIQNPRERRGWSPQVILRAGNEATDTRTGEKYLVPTIRVVFAGQQVTTQDPEVQFYLETKNDNSIVWGEEGKKAWDRIYLTADQQKEIAQRELDSLHKQIEDGNALLEQTKARVGKNAAAVAP